LIAITLLLIGGITSRYHIEDMPSEIYLEEGLGSGNIIVQNVGYVSEDPMLDGFDIKGYGIVVGQGMVNEP
jgi:hypothetical protein